MEHRINIPDWLDRPLVRLVLLYRRIRYGYTFRRIPLTQGKFAIVDPDDFDRLTKYKWYALKAPHTFYAIHDFTSGENRTKKGVQMHNFLIKAPPGCFLDHINHNGLDNRKANLRPATHTQNIWHRRKSKTPSRSRYKGVAWSKTHKKWRARIQVNGKRIFLGGFHDEIQAARAYDKAAKKYHREFAVLNFPLPR